VKYELIKTDISIKIKIMEEKTEIQKALELIKKDKSERQQRAFEKITKYIQQIEEEENVSVLIQPINLQPQLTIIAK
jgi:hypothetical protein